MDAVELNNSFLQAAEDKPKVLGPLVSVSMPAFNAERYIGEQLKVFCHKLTPILN